MGNQALFDLGFRPYRSGSTEYWVRPADPSDTWVRNMGACRPHRIESGRPLVVCHGIGVGPTMCLPFLQRLTRGLGKDYPIFLVDSAAVSMRFSDDVPGAREVASNVSDMLE
ncbi:unnamed protein product, partial [Polarella glacialis]